MSVRRLLHVLWIWGPVLGYVGLIFYLSSLSKIPWAALYPDYIEHSTEYGGLAILTARAMNDGLRRTIGARTLLISFLLCVAYAISDEIHQKFVPDRFADVMDVLSDAVGAGVGLMLLLLWQRLAMRVRGS